MPGNPTIEQWLADFAGGAGSKGDFNGPTDEQILNSILHAAARVSGTSATRSPPAGTGPDYSETAAFFHQLWTDLGIRPVRALCGADLVLRWRPPTRIPAS